MIAVRGVRPKRHYGLRPQTAIMAPAASSRRSRCGQNGDATSNDGTYSTNTLRLPTDAMVAPGPVGLRFTAANRAGHVLMVDTEGLEARAP